MAAAPLLEVKGLSVELQRGSERRADPRRCRLHRARTGRCSASIGESGSGKTVLAAAAGRLDPAAARAHGRSGAVPGPRPVSPCREPSRLALRGRHIGYIGADPGSSFDPTLPVGVQIAEKLRARRARQIGRCRRASSA